MVVVTAQFWPSSCREIYSPTTSEAGEIPANTASVPHDEGQSVASIEVLPWLGFGVKSSPGQAIANSTAHADFFAASA